MCRYQITLALLLYTLSGLGRQSDNSLNGPPSPNASSLLKYVSTPVSLYTGTPVINLPITNLNGKDVSLPISVSYHASGIKVQDIASWVGLGWSLNAGGLITRMVRGLPDESPNGYCGSNNIGSKSSLPIDQTYVNNISNRTWDGEPDLFYFNFLGMTGQFILTSLGSPKALPHSNFKITPAIGQQGVGKWIIQNVEGVKYTFGPDASSTEYSSSNKLNIDGTTINYISSWYLVSIEYPNGEKISLNYTSGDQINFKYFLQTLSFKVAQTSVFGSGCITPTLSPADNNIVSTIAAPKYLSSVSTSVSRIEFIPGSVSREDLPGGKYLDQIIVYDNADAAGNNDNVIEKYKFNYSYFVSDGCSSELCKRLKLESVDKLGVGSQIRLGAFDYNLSTNLPSRDSHAIDHWGYYNSNSASTKIPTTTFTDLCYSTTYAGADKASDSVRTKANILTKITFSTGGFQEFKYSANSYYDSGDKIVGGVRVWQLIESDGINSKTSYFSYKNDGGYSSGKVLSIPVYNYTYNYSSLQSSLSYRMLIVFSQSQINLFDLNGYHISYGKVRFYQLNNGYTDSFFTNFVDHFDDPPVQFNFQNSQGATIDSRAYPFTANTSKSYERGILNKRNYYSVNNKLLRSEIFNYDYTQGFSLDVRGYKSGLISYADSYQNQNYQVGKYSITSKPIVLDNTVEIVYDQTTSTSDLSKYVSTTKKHTFNLTTLLPTEIVIYNTDQPSLKQISQLKYAYDYGFYGENAPADMEVASLALLNDNYRMNTPVEVLQLSEDGGVRKLISATIYKYKIFGNSTFTYVKPTGIWNLKSYLDLTGTNQPYAAAAINQLAGTFVIDSRMRKINTFSEYDNTSGNLLSQSGLDGITNSYQWTERDTQLGSKTIQSQQTVYGYKSLVGVSSIIDPNQQKISFEYDNLNRLYLVRDHAGSTVGNIGTRYRYNSKGEDSSLKTDYSASPLYSKISGSLTFTSLYDNEVYASNSYIWDFGDGQVVQNAAKTVTHAYSSAGDYVVKLSKINQEYGSQTVSKTIKVYPPITNIVVASPANGTTMSACATLPSISVSKVGGCPNLTYSWQARLGTSGSWFSVSGNSASINFQTPGVGTYYFRCTISDDCSQTGSSNEDIKITFNKPAGCNIQ